MDRLTEKDNEGYKLVLKSANDCESENLKEWSISTSKTRTQTIRGYAVDRFAEYEDLEEQGKLVKFPCKVGDTVWYINERLEKQGRKKVTVFFVDKGIVDNITLGSLMIPQIEVCNNKENSWITFDYKDDWNKIVFPTCKKAEAALQKMNEMEDLH